MPPLPGATVEINSTSTPDAAATAQQAINQQAQVLASLNPSMLAGNPALLQLLNQQAQVQQLQKAQQQQPLTPSQMSAPASQQSALQAQLLALQNLQQSVQQQQHQPQQGQQSHFAALASLPGVQGMTTLAGAPSPGLGAGAASQNPSAPVQIVVHHHHNDGRTSSGTPSLPQSDANVPLDDMSQAAMIAKMLQLQQQQMGGATGTTSGNA